MNLAEPSPSNLGSHIPDGKPCMVPCAVTGLKVHGHLILGDHVKPAPT